MDKKMKLEVTKKGYPALWECGGGYTKTGGCTIIAGRHGERLVATYVRHGGHLACCNHALFIVEAVYHVIQAYQHCGDYEISVYKISSIDRDGDVRYANLTQVNEYSCGEWDIEPEPFLAEAINAAIEKADCYHCGSMHYGLEQPKRPIL